jgi:hypothetical protein
MRAEHDWCCSSEAQLTAIAPNEREIMETMTQRITEILDRFECKATERQR